MDIELELGDDAEIAAAALQRPQQLRVLISVRAHHVAAAVTSSAPVRLEAVMPNIRPSQPLPLPSVSPVTPVSETRPPGTANPFSKQGRVELAPVQAGADPRGLRLGVDLDGLHRRDVDDDPAVDAGIARRGVPAAADRHREVVLGAEGERRDHVVARCAAGDHRRMLVDHPVEELAVLVVARVAGADHLAVETGAKLIQIGRLENACLHLLDSFP